MSAHVTSSLQSGDKSRTTAPVVVVAKRVRTVEMDVKLVLNGLVSVVENAVQKTAEECEEKGRKGAQKRESYDYSFKMNVINELDEGVCAEDVAFNNRIHKSLVSKWKCVRKEIIDGAASKQLKLLKKGRSTKKHNAMFEKLIPYR